MVKQNNKKDTAAMEKDMSDSRMMELIVDSLPLAMFCKDYQSGIGEFVGWNKTAKSLWGLEKGSVMGKSDYDFFPKDQAEFFKEKDLETINDNTLVFIKEEPVDSPNGRVFVRTWKVPINGRFLLGISQDLSEVKKLESELEQQKVLSFNSARLASLGEMSCGIAHEINNPLTILTGNIEILRRKKKNGGLSDEEFETRLNTLDDTISRIKSIVSGLMAFSQDGIDDIFQNTEVSQLINSSLDFFRQNLDQLGIELRLDIEDNIGKITCKKNQISQTLISLLSNAKTAARLGNENWIEVGARQEGEGVQIRITDSGPGISKESQDKIFEPFFTTKNVGEGTGLGLSISKGLIEHHGGRLILDRQHKYTSFLIFLPRKPVEKTNEDAA